MRSTIGTTALAALLALAGCSSTGGGASAPPVVADGNAMPAVTGNKLSVCTSQAARKYGVTGNALSLSNDYSTAEGDAIDGAATLPDGFKRFRCDFGRDGSFVAITDITGQA